MLLSDGRSFARVVAVERASIWSRQTASAFQENSVHSTKSCPQTRYLYGNGKKSGGSASLRAHLLRQSVRNVIPYGIIYIKTVVTAKSAWYLRINAIKIPKVHPSRMGMTYKTSTKFILPQTGVMRRLRVLKTLRKRIAELKTYRNCFASIRRQLDRQLCVNGC